MARASAGLHRCDRVGLVAGARHGFPHRHGRDEDEQRARVARAVLLPLGMPTHTLLLVTVTLAALALPDTALAQASDPAGPEGRVETGPVSVDSARAPLARLDEAPATVLASRRAQRFELGGWVLAGMSVVGTSFLVLAYSGSCEEGEWGCFGALEGLSVGLMAFGAPLVAGVVLGVMGTARRRRLQHDGTWALAFVGSGARFELAF